MADTDRLAELERKFAENPRRYFAPLANELRKAGDLAAAVRLCRDQLARFPGHMSGHVVLGQALYESRRPDDAREAFAHALELDPENLIALRHLGDIARDAGDAGAARGWYQRVLEADPRNDDIAAQLERLAPAARMAAPAPAPAPVAFTPAPPPPPPVEPLEWSALDLDLPGAAPATETPTPVVPAPMEPDIEHRPVPAHGLLDVDLVDLGLAPATAAPVEASDEGAASESGSESLDDAADGHQVPPIVVAWDDLLPELPAAGELEIADRAPAAAAAGWEESRLLGPVDEPDVRAPDGEPPVEPAPAERGVDDGHDPEASVAREGDGVAERPHVELLTLDAPPAVAMADEPPPANQEDAGVPEEHPIVESVSQVDDPAARAETAAVTSGPEAPSAPQPEPRADPDPSRPAEPAAAELPRRDVVEEDAPSYDPVVGLDLAPEEAADIAAGTVVDAPEPNPEPDPEPAIELEPAPEPTGSIPSPTFATETMAELLLRQGHRDEALGVYDRLVAQRPDDGDLRDRVAALREQPAPASTAGAFFAALAAPVGDPTEPPAAAIVDAAEPEAEVPAEGPLAGAVSAADELAADRLASGFDAVDDGPSTLLAALGARPAAAPPPPPAPPPPAPAATSNGLAEFSFERFFEGLEEPGQVAHDVPAPASPDAWAFGDVPRSEGRTPTPSSPATAVHPAPEPAEDDDLAQFNAWLKGLVQP